MMYWEKIGEYEWDNNIININSKELIAMREKTSDYPIIYCDMDGFLAWWNHKRSPEHPEGVTMEEVFSKGYFENLPIIESFVEFCKVMYEKGYDIHIASKAKYFAIEEKIKWLNKYLPFITTDKMHFVPIEGDKSNYVPKIKKTDIIIDDYNPNLIAWQGSAIKAINDKNSINPNFPWIHYLNPIYKNLDVITWTMLRDYAVQYRQGMGTKEGLKYIYDRSSMTAEEFISICKGFNLPEKEITAAMKTEPVTTEEKDDISMEL